MITLIWLLHACGSDPTPPEPTPAQALDAFLSELCGAAAGAGTALEGELPTRDLPPRPGAPFPRLTVSDTEATWNSMPVTAETLPERLARHPIPNEVVVQAGPEVEAARVGELVAVLRASGVSTVLGAVRVAAPPAVPSPPEPDLVSQLDRIPQPHLRMAELQRQVDTAVGDCGHARLAFTIASDETGDRCDVWRRQLAPALNLCPTLSHERLATLTWVMEHPTPDAFWTTVPVPAPMPTTGTWDAALSP